MGSCGNRSAVVAGEIRPPQARIKIGPLACDALSLSLKSHMNLPFS